MQSKGERVLEGVEGVWGWGGWRGEGHRRQ